MGSLKNCFRLFQCVFYITCIGYFNHVSGSSHASATNTSGAQDDFPFYRLPIGVVFDKNTDELQQAFAFAIKEQAQKNLSDKLKFEILADVIHTADSFKLSRLVCKQFTRGVLAIYAAVQPDSFETFHSYVNTFHMPFVTPYLPEKMLRLKTGYPDYAMSILPDYHKAVLETVTYYGWENVIYLYDSLEGLLRLQQFYKELTPGRKPNFRIANVKNVKNAQEIISYLRQLEKTDRWSNKYVILDCSTKIAKDTLVLHVRDVKLGRRNYHYLLTGLVLDDHWDKEILEYNTINITGFKLVDTSRKFVKDFFATWKHDHIAANSALMYDAVLTVTEAFQRLFTTKTHIIENVMSRSKPNHRYLNCNARQPFKYGDEIANYIRKTEVEGLSGKIKFSESGERINFALVVVQNNHPDGEMNKIATWYDDRGFRPLHKLNNKLHTDNVLGNYDRNKTYIVASILEPPYFTKSGPDNVPNSNVRYGGFCAELAELIAYELDIKIQIRLSADGEYGKVNPDVIGGWDGMIGELVRKEIDMVIAPLIMTARREAVVDFSHPFISFNHLSAKTKEKKSIYGFLKPLSKDAWYAIVGSMLLIGVVKIIVSCLSPAERRVVNVTDTAQSKTNDDTEASVTRSSVANKFSFINSLWYSLSTAVKQTIKPRSISERMVRIVWRLHVCLIAISYTSNLAYQLVSTNLESSRLPIYNKMTKCPEDMQADNTQNYMVDNVQYEHLDSTGHKNFRPEGVSPNHDTSDCQMLLSILDPGIKEFAVAFPKGSKLRTGVNLALKTLRQEKQLDKLLVKHFYELECSVPPPVALGGTEMNLEDIIGAFYLLFIFLGTCLLVGLFEFCVNHRSKVANAFCAKTRQCVNEVGEPNASDSRRRRRRDQDRRRSRSEPAPESYAALPALLELSSQSLRDQMRPAGTMTRRSARDSFMRQSQESLELVSRPHFTSANQTEQEESITQI